MMYNYNPYGYNPYQNPAMSYQNPTVQAQPGEIIWVQGEEGAKAYNVAPGRKILLMDSETSTFYIKSTDATGVPQPLEIYDFNKREATAQRPLDMSQYVRKDELGDYVRSLINEELTNESTV